MKRRPIVVLYLLLGVVCFTVSGLAAQEKPAAPSSASKSDAPPPAGQAPTASPADQLAPPSELKGTRPSSEQEKAVFTQANDLYEKGDYDLAIFNLQEFISRYQESPDLPRAYFLLGESYLRTQAFQLAVPNLRKVVEEYQTMPFFQTAMEDLAQAYTELGDADHAVSLYQQLLDMAKDQGSRAVLHDRIAELQLKKKDYIKAIESLLAERSLVQEAERSAITDRISAILDQDLKEKDLQKMVLLYPRTFPGDTAVIKLAQFYESKGDVYRTERELQRFLRAFPKHDQVPQVRVQLAAIKKKIQSHRQVIGVLLPLSGKLSVFGEEVVNGIQIAMDQMKDSFKEDQVGVAIVDSAEPSATVLSQLDLLNKEYSPIAVIGPLLSKEVVQLAPRIERLQIPLISPSATAPGLSKESKYIFRNSITNEQQGKAMAEYAVNALGLKRFVILHPNDQHGAGLSQVFKTEVARLGGTILTVQAYPMEDTDFGPQLKQIKEIDLKETGTLTPVEGKDKSPPEYIPGFDAIFLPGDADKVGLIAGQLAFYDFKKITLLGSNGWNSKDLIRIGGRFMEGGVFVDGFFAGSSDPAVQSFVERYRARYQTEPTIFAAQAYDITRIILTALQRGITNGSALRDYLLTVRDFAGASGRLNFTPEGANRRRVTSGRSLTGREGFTRSIASGGSRCSMRSQVASFRPSGRGDVGANLWALFRRRRTPSSGGCSSRRWRRASPSRRRRRPCHFGPRLSYRLFPFRDGIGVVFRDVTNASAGRGGPEGERAAASRTERGAVAAGGRAAGLGLFEIDWRIGSDSGRRNSARSCACRRISMFRRTEPLIGSLCPNRSVAAFGRRSPIRRGTVRPGRDRGRASDHRLRRVAGVDPPARQNLFR